MANYKIKESAQLIVKQILTHKRSEHKELIEEISAKLVREREYSLSALFRGIAEMQGIGR